MRIFKLINFFPFFYYDNRMSLSMKSLRRIFFSTRFVMLLFLQIFFSSPGFSSADLILFNGAVVTLDSVSSIAEAVAVEDGRIIFAGSKVEVRGFADDRTEWIDLKGAAVLPGFIDAHGQSFSILKG